MSQIRLVHSFNESLATLIAYHKALSEKERALTYADTDDLEGLGRLIDRINAAAKLIAAYQCATGAERKVRAAYMLHHLDFQPHRFFAGDYAETRDIAVLEAFLAA